MKILIAGASGAIGLPLIDLLIQDGHEVFGMTQSKEKASLIAGKGAKPVKINVLEKETVSSTLATLKPEVVVDMLTHLPKEYTPESMRQAAEMDAKIRLEGGSNLQTAAEACGALRYIAQSAAFWYAPGEGLADENVPFAFDASPGIASGCRVYEKIEQRVLQSEKLDGVALRFGFFYGPGTWFHPEGSAADQVRKRQFPIIGTGNGIWNFVHIHDAAKAIAAAVYCFPGAYNIVNNYPVAMKEWLPAFARYLGTNHPPHISEEEGLKQGGADAVYYATKLRGASNGKAKRELNFQPKTFEWFL
jgi:nucleoside-diphosphate-sugar epimerase